MVSFDGIDYEYKKLHRFVEIARSLMHKPQSSFLHFSFITKGTHIYSIGWNDVTKTSKLVKYPLGGVHAEAMSIGGLENLNLCRKATLINIRLNPRKELRLSKPCDVCLGFVKKMGFKKIFYSTEVGFEFMDLRSF